MNLSQSGGQRPRSRCGQGGSCWRLRDRELQACPTSGGRQQPWHSLACGHTSAVAGLPVTWSVTSPLLSHTRTCATGLRAGRLLGPSSSASACFTPQTQSSLLLSRSLCRRLSAPSSLLVPGLGSPQWLHVFHDQGLTQSHKGSCSFTWCLFDLPCVPLKRRRDNLAQSLVSHILGCCFIDPPRCTGVGGIEF